MFTLGYPITSGGRGSRSGAGGGAATIPGTVAGRGGGAAAIGTLTHSGTAASVASTGAGLQGDSVG